MLSNAPIQQTTSLCRRLLTSGNNADRLEASNIILERLRMNINDTKDDVNTLLHLLANHMIPTNDFTQELLSLLYFCDHKVLIINHLSHLTYQSKECVKLVVEAYLELLSNDRSLLSPILGSLADLPLELREKTCVIEKTKGLLDAADEQDLPAVVQSLLLMITRSTANDIVSSLRQECQRISSEILSLCFDVITRLSAIGSISLRAFIALIRQSQDIIVFDLLLLTHLMDISTGVDIATRTLVIALRQHKLQPEILKQTAEVMTKGSHWNHLLPPFIRLCNFLLTFPFQYKVANMANVHLLITNTIQAVSILVATRSRVHEEALLLLLKLSSQPLKLIMLTNMTTQTNENQKLCWMIATCTTNELLNLSKNHQRSISPFAHVVLDHLHSVASTGALYNLSNDENVKNIQLLTYPSDILDTFCATMAILAIYDRGIFSLVMITVQKQLTPGMLFSSNAHRHILPHNRMALDKLSGNLRPLIAILLTKHLLVNLLSHSNGGSSNVDDEDSEKRDCRTLLISIFRMLSTSVTDDLLRHILPFSNIKLLLLKYVIKDTILDALQDEQQSLRQRIETVFKKKGLQWYNKGGKELKHDEMYVYFGEEVECLKDTESVIVDVLSYVKLSSIGSSRGFLTSISSLQKNPDRLATAPIEYMEASTISKIKLLHEWFKVLPTDREKESLLWCGFIVPKEYQYLPNLSSNLAYGSDLLWSLAMALEISISCLNEAAEKIIQQKTPKITNLKQKQMDVAKLVSRCLHCESELQILVKKFSDTRVQPELIMENRDDSERALHFKNEITIVKRLLSAGTHTSKPFMSLFGIHMSALVLLFALFWKEKRSFTKAFLVQELKLLEVLNWQLTNTKQCHLNILLDSPHGRRTLKYLGYRFIELGDLLQTLQTKLQKACSYSNSDENSDKISKFEEQISIVENSVSWIHRIVALIFEEAAIRKTMDSVVELLAEGIQDGNYSENTVKIPYYKYEVVYQALQQQATSLQHLGLICSLVDVVAILVGRANQKQNRLSQLCTSFVHNQLLLTWDGSKLVDTNPPISCIISELKSRPFLQLLPECIHAMVNSKNKRSMSTLDSGAAYCSLLNYKCSPKWRPLVLFITASWCFYHKQNGGNYQHQILTLYLMRMKELVEFNGNVLLFEQQKEWLKQQKMKKRPKKATAKALRSKSKRQRISSESSSNESEPDHEISHVRALMESRSLVAEGEHQILKTLTNESFHVFLDAVILCSIGSLCSAAIGHSNKLLDNPMGDIISSIRLVRNCMRVYIQAEEFGFNLPEKTNLLILRSGCFLVSQIIHIVDKCIVRVTTSDDDHGNIPKRDHLQIFFTSLLALVDSMTEVVKCFQVRVDLKMDQSLTSNSKGKGSKSWSNSLQEQAFGKSFQRRKCISKAESKVLPHFSHCVEDFSAYLKDLSEVQNLDMSEQLVAELISLFNEMDANDINSEIENLQSDYNVLDLSCSEDVLKKKLVEEWSEEIGSNEITDDFEDAIDETESIPSSDDGSETDSDVGFRAKTKGDLIENEDLGFTPIVIDYKKQIKKVVKQ